MKDPNTKKGPVRVFHSFEELPSLGPDGKFDLAESPTDKPPTRALAPEKPEAQAPASLPTKSDKTTRATKENYDEFFRVYASAVKQDLPGFRPLGYIPGPAAIFEFREEGEIRILEATPDVTKELGTSLPTPWIVWDKLPEKIRNGLTNWKALVDGLGYKLSPFHFGLARALQNGKLPAKYLAMGMTHFQYGDRQVPFGVVLLPLLPEKLKVEKIYNPERIPNVPEVGTLLTLSDLREGEGPIQKLLKVLTRMENNYFARYGENRCRGCDDQSGNAHRRCQPQASGRFSRRPPEFKFRRPPTC